MIGFFRFLLVVLLLTVVAMTSAIVTMHFAIHGAEISTPNFRGLTMADAGQRAAADGLSLHVQNKLYSTDVPTGRVANQSPVPGTIVRRGWLVWLTQSLGPQKLAIPNTLGRDQRVASIEIRRAGLQTGTVAALPHPQAQAGTVIAQSPQPGASGVASPMVNLLVSGDASMQTTGGFVMPDLHGQLFTAAALFLSHSGFQLSPLKTQDMHLPAANGPGVPTPPAKPAAPSGTIVAQVPLAGSRVDQSMPIQLTVAQ
ncbi:MAG TPA: PASTA domain-containing protein [Acidobacteriaceae bacterium]|jgi:beta-lactam-binding protein with PASTA domain|nr:PASTA domain-containing protein [Acidobacteriaceae bacterium]